MARDKSKPRKRGFLTFLGPGLITGAADDDPSGIATYSQAGAGFGLNMLWTMVFTLPLMMAIQSVAARIGRVTGCGLAANMRKLFPGWAVALVVVLLLIANVINIAADVSAMGAAARLVLPEPFPHLYVIVFAGVSILLQALVPYERYVRILKWLTLSLLAYVGVILIVGAPWQDVFAAVLAPKLTFDRVTVTMVVAIFGTTISPYLFFWQSSQEVEEIATHPREHALRDAPGEAPDELRRIRYDTEVGMLFSNAVAFFVILTAAVTLHAHGITEIESAAQAASALRPLAGDLAFALFAAGIIGTGMLAIPVLAGSAAWAVAETLRWPGGLSRKVRDAVGFYSVMAVATAAGVGFEFSGIDPIRALVGAAVVNGVVAPVVMIAAMLIGSNRGLMGAFVISGPQKILGWLAVLVMTGAAVTLLFI